jgi:hypothetical protein
MRLFVLRFRCIAVFVDDNRDDARTIWHHAHKGRGGPQREAHAGWGRGGPQRDAHARWGRGGPVVTGHHCYGPILGRGGPSPIGPPIIVLPEEGEAMPTQGSMTRALYCPWHFSTLLFFLKNVGDSFRLFFFSQKCGRFVG